MALRNVFAAVIGITLGSVQASVAQHGNFLTQPAHHNRVMLHTEGKEKVGPAASVAAGEGPAAEYAQASYNAWLMSTLISIAIFVISTYLVYKWHHEMREKGQGPQCGWKSILCCLCCTVATICFPIDEGRTYDDAPRQ